VPKEAGLAYAIGDDAEGEDEDQDVGFSGDRRASLVSRRCALEIDFLDLVRVPRGVPDSVQPLAGNPPPRLLVDQLQVVQYCP